MGVPGGTRGRRDREGKRDEADYERKDTYVVCWTIDGVTQETRFDNIPDDVKFASFIYYLFDTITRIDIEMGDLVKIGA